MTTMPHNLDERRLLIEWRDARQAIFDHTATMIVTPALMDRLAKAEHALMAHARTIDADPIKRATYALDLLKVVWTTPRPAEGLTLTEIITITGGEENAVKAALIDLWWESLVDELLSAVTGIATRYTITRAGREKIAEAKTP